MILINFIVPAEYVVIVLVKGYARFFKAIKTALQYFVNISEKTMRALFQEFGKEFRIVIKGDIQQAIEDNNRIICDLLRQEIRASANGVKSELRQEMRLMKGEIISSFIDLVDNAILPQIGDLDRRVTVLEARGSKA